MSKLYHRNTKRSLVDVLFGIKCPHCATRGKMHYRYGSYTRGYCHTRRQAIGGGPAFYCMNCSKITWCTPFEVWVAPLKKLTNNFTFYPDTESAKYFPNFKFNVKS